MIKAQRLENELMHSNCYVVSDDVTKECLIIDPGSRESLKEIDFIQNNGLKLGYIILTHEHTDHTWGVNSLLEKYPNAKVVAYDKCIEQLPLAGDMYFRLYYDDPSYHYEVERVDIAIKNEEDKKLGSFDVRFIPTPGHSIGSMSILIDNFLFTGDTMMKYKIYVSKKTGDAETLKKSCQYLISIFPDVVVFPGHGNQFPISEY